MNIETVKEQVFFRFIECQEKRLQAENKNLTKSITEISDISALQNLQQKIKFNQIKLSAIPIIMNSYDNNDLQDFNNFVYASLSPEAYSDYLDFVHNFTDLKQTLQESE